MPVQVWHGLAQVPADWGRSVVTIGVFDGVHRGHQRIAGRAAEIARERGLPYVAVTFDPHPDEVIRPGTHPPLLCSLARRAELLGELGADAVCIVAFTHEFSQMNPDEFARTVLVSRLHAAAVVVGEKFRFGHKAAGDSETLRALGRQYGFDATAVPLVTNGRTISSTYIRERLGQGDVATAARALGRPHRVEGVVVGGQGRGRGLGFPTANIGLPPHTAIPADGVYAGWLQHGRSRWPAAISIGTNPTFAGVARTVEAHALDADDLDLYTEHVAVDFVARLRDMVRFESRQALVEQMRADAEKVRTITRESVG